WKIIEPNARRTHSFGAHPRVRADPLAPYRIGEDTHPVQLDQECGMVDKCDLQFCRSFRRLSRSTGLNIIVAELYPLPAVADIGPFEHVENTPGSFTVVVVRIEKVASVKMVGLWAFICRGRYLKIDDQEACYYDGGN